MAYRDRVVPQWPNRRLIPFWVMWWSWYYTTRVHRDAINKKPWHILDPWDYRTPDTELWRFNNRPRSLSKAFQALQRVVGALRS